MTDDFSHSPPAPPAANGVASGDKPQNAADAPTAASTETKVATAAPDENCASDEERFSRLQANRSRDEAVRFANELSCEELRPQLRAMIDDFSHSTPARPAAKGVPSGAKPQNAADAPTAASTETKVATAAPDENCASDEERF